MAALARETGTPTGPALVVTDAQLQAFVDDDLGPAGRDATTDALFDGSVQGHARLVTHADTIASGIDEGCRVFRLLGATATPRVLDGDHVPAGATLIEVQGPTRALLVAERTALNIMARMCGIASRTRTAQDLVAASSPTCRVAATRKTTPGFRVFEKRAVLHGGGDPHRYGLFDQILIKDNHRAAGPDLGTLIDRVRAANPDLVLEVEVEDMADAEVAARRGVDWLLVDNQDAATVGRIAARVRAIDPDIRIEASGGITADTAPEYARHVDRVSMGSLTQQAQAVDLSLEWGG